MVDQTNAVPFDQPNPAGQSQDESVTHYYSAPAGVPIQLQNPDFRFVKIKKWQKKPFEKEWPTLGNYRYSDIDFQKWIADGNNWGSIGGFGCLLIVDADCEEIAKMMENSKLNETFQTKSGREDGGVHYYYILDGDGIPTQELINDKKEVLADIVSEGHQAVGPGSTHPNGKLYHVIKDAPLMHITSDQLMEILGEYGLRIQLSNEAVDKIIKENDDKNSDIDLPIKNIVSKIGGKYMYSDSRGYQGDNPAPGHPNKNHSCLVINYENNTWKCFHPDHGGGGPLQLIAVLEGIIPCAGKKTGALRGETFKQVIKIAEEKYGLIRPKYEELGLPKIEEGDSGIAFSTIDADTFIKRDEKGKKSVDIDAVVSYIRSFYTFKTIYGRTGEEIKVFKDGIYSDAGREIIKTTSEQILKNWAKTNTVNEIFEKIKRKTAVDRGEFSNLPLHLVPCLNGIYNINERRLDTFDQKLPFTYKVPVNYKKDAKCEIFLKFINEAISPDDIPVIQEWFGFCLYRSYFLKKGIIFVGEKDTGKTVMLIVLTAFLGDYNVTGVNLQDITNGNNFDLASLYNKLANIFDDLSSADLNNGGGFKIATGGGYITAEYKFGDKFQFKNYSKQTFACNNVPVNKKNDDPAYFDRWMPIEFSNSVPVSEQDPFLSSKLTSPEELSGIFNWAIDGLERLLKNKKFSYNKSADEVKRIMERSGNPLAEFVQDVLVEEQGSIMTRDEMWITYSAWAKISGRTRLSKEQLGRQLELQANYIVDKRDVKRYWKNVKINRNYTFIDTLDTFIKSYREENINGIQCNIYNGIPEKASKTSNDNVDNMNIKGVENGEKLL